MNENSRTKGNRNGATLVVVMVLTLLGTLAASSVAFCTGQRVWQAYRQVNLEQAFYLAAAGAERAASRVASGNETSGTLAATLGAGSYSVAINCQNGAGEVQIDVTSVGTVAGVSRTVVLHGLRRVSWARYALWYNSESPDGLVMAAGESFRGRVYSKPTLRFSNVGITPYNHVHFYDRVWTVQDHIDVDPGADPIFDQGIVYNAEIESMASVNFADLQAKAVSAGKVLEGPTTIVIDGSQMKVVNARKGWTTSNPGIITIPESNKVLPTPGTQSKVYFTVYVKNYSTTLGDITISAPNGVGNRLTLISDNDIKIAGHIKYKVDPLVDPSSTDALGLIAKRDVMVQTSAPYDASICAHIMCQNGGFGVVNYDSRAQSGKLNVVGGIVNNVRKAVGTVRPTGYKKNYVFDTRFAKYPPPNYPVLTDELEWSEWEG